MNNGDRKVCKQEHLIQNQFHIIGLNSEVPLPVIRLGHKEHNIKAW